MKAQNIFAWVIAALICSCLPFNEQKGKKHEIACSADVQIIDGKISITFDAPCNIELKNGEFRVGIESANNALWALGSNYPEIKALHDGNKWNANYKNSPDFPDLNVTLEPKDNRLVIQAELCNPHPDAIKVYGLEIPCFASEFGATNNFGSEVLLLQNGYDSWSFAGVLKKRYYDPLLPECNGTICDSGNNNSYKDISGISFWSAVITSKPDGPGLAIGALSAKRLKSRVAVGHKIYLSPDIRLIEGATGDAITLETGECYSLDPVALVANSDPLRAAIEYGALVAEKNPMPKIPEKFEDSSGWSSWYCLFDDVTEKDILDNARILAQEGYAERGYRILQIDDGYEQAFGDWEVNEKFPRGLAPPAGDIKSYGLIAGIWFAPFAADCESNLVKNHPDWFVRDKNTGELYYYKDPFLKPLCGLDATQPDAASWLYQQTRSFKDAGFEYFKLDFLFMGAVEGARFQDVTSLEAFNRGLEIIKDALGDDVFILACGHPFLATAGFAHGARTSSDITSIDRPLFPLLIAAARSNAARFYSAMWQLVDPDNLLLREPYNDDERLASLAVDALFAGVHILGDDLRTLDQSAKDILFNPAIEEIKKQKGMLIPVDLFWKVCPDVVRYNALELLGHQSELPSLWLKLSSDKRWLGVINWSNEPVSYTIEPAHVGAKENVTIKDVLTGEEIVLSASIDLTKHEGRIFEVEANF